MMPRTALLLIAHGSRRTEANAELVAICESLKARGHDQVQPAYLEFAEPDIATGGAFCVAAGASNVVMLPYFLSPGRHVVDDLAAARDELAGRFPDVTFTLAEPLGSHPLILDALEARANGAMSRRSPTGTAPATAPR